ncbi:hypothetical protein HDV00_005162 [Rhizophlyctis rosea]|nr:hypothetical protein HDV00_005162 [Rhizophlyctis rosea]
MSGFGKLPFTCFENTLGLTQVTVQFFCFSFIVILFYKYYPTQLIDTPLHERDVRVSYVFISYLSLATLVVIFMLAVPLHGSIGISVGITAVAGVFGAIAIAATICQFFPQIVHTWSAKKVGALSIPMMLMQVPGAFVFVASLASQPGTNASSWLSFLVSGIMQFILLCLCLVYQKREKGDETDPLLPEEDPEGRVRGLGEEGVGGYGATGTGTGPAEEGYGTGEEEG